MESRIIPFPLKNELHLRGCGFVVAKLFMVYALKSWDSIQIDWFFWGTLLV